MEDDSQRAAGLFELIPEDGTSIGNVTLRKKWEETCGSDQPRSEEEYWFVRQQLLDSGQITLGRGKGGSVRRVSAPQADPTPLVQPPASAAPLTTRSRETDLYGPLRDTILHTWARAELALPRDAFVVSVSGLQGRAETGGKWSRPDLTLVWARRFRNLGPKIEVVTFEVKLFSDLNVGGAFEAAAHTARAHKAYLLGEVQEAQMTEFFESDQFYRIEEECLRFGVGFATFTDAQDAETWEVHVRPQTHSPDPVEVDRWVSQCFIKSDTELRKLIDSVLRDGDTQQQPGAPPGT